MTSPLPDAETVAAKLEWLVGGTDHERGCQGREYTCDCGHDQRVESALLETATLIRFQASETASLRATIAALEAERDEALRMKEAWFNTHTAHREANAALGHANGELFKRAYEAERARERAGSSLSTKTAEVERLREALERTERNRDMWKSQCDNQAATLLEYHLTQSEQAK